MEIHKGLVVGTSFTHPSEGVDSYWDSALSFVQTKYPEEINRVSSIKFCDIDSDTFFNEYIWVVHATGFSAKVVSKFINRLLDAYGKWSVLALENEKDVVRRVSPIINNPQKIKSVKRTSELILKGVKKHGWDEFRDLHLSTPKGLTELPYIGTVTCHHLARNIGILDSVKPDLHLVRLSEFWGFSSCDEMCRHISEKSGYPVGIVDLVLWYTASSFGTTDIKGQGKR